MSRSNQVWTAFAEEAQLAASQLATGVTKLGKVRYDRKVDYIDAFFSLATGFERSAKICIVVDYALRNANKYPPNNLLLGYSHNLRRALDEVDSIVLTRGFQDRNSQQVRLPNELVHQNIISILTQFARQTRYYNLNLITYNAATTLPNAVVDPVEEWAEKVTHLLVNQLVPQFPEYKNDISLFEQALSTTKSRRKQKMLAIRQYELLKEQGNWFGESLWFYSVRDFTAPYIRMFIMQIARFLAEAIQGLVFESYNARLFIPHLSEIYTIFLSSDEYFRSRKTWSIYP